MSESKGILALVDRKYSFVYERAALRAWCRVTAEQQ